jgi:hypothetical protein
MRPDRVPADVGDRVAPLAMTLAQVGQPMNEGERAPADDPFVHEQRAVTREATLLAAASDAYNEHQTATLRRCVPNVW